MHHRIVFPFLLVSLVGCQSPNIELVALYSSASEAVAIGYQQSFGPIPKHFAAHEKLEVLDYLQVAPNIVACLVRDKSSGSEGWVAGDDCQRLPTVFQPSPQNGR